MTETDVVESQLTAYWALVRKWAPRIDLLAPGDVGRFRKRHIEDCLRLRPLLRELPEGTAVDVGSGAGLPGLVLAIAAPRRPWRLLEPRGRRAAFLEEVVRELGLANVQVSPITAEEAASDPALRGAHVLAVARALAPPHKSFGLLRPLLSSLGIAVVFVGKNAQIPAGAKEWQRGIAVVPAGDQEEG
jgi:16S rRNA (guanine527-N7)-methyltransferase